MSISEPSTPRYFRIEEFCQLVGLSRSTAYLLIKEKRLRTVRIVGRRLIPAEAIEEFLIREAS